MSDNSSSMRTKGSVFEYIAPLISVVVGVIILYASQFIVALGFVFFKVDYSKYMGTYDSIYAVIAICGLLLFSYVSRIFYKDFKSGILIKKPQGIEVFACVLIALGILGFVAVYMAVVTDIAKVFSSKGSDTVSEQLEKYADSVDRYSDIAVETVPKFDKILDYISLVILVPIAEELLFRGIILGQLMKKYNPWLSIFASALVFGIMHGLSVHVGYAFFCGIFIGIVYYATSNISLTVLIHMIFNFLGGTLSMILSDGVITVPDGLMDTVMQGVGVVELYSMTPAALFMVFLIVRKNKQKKQNDKIKTSEVSEKKETAVEIV